MQEKTYYVNEDYPAETWESILGLTTETARNILDDDEFIRWYEERNARFPDGHYLPLEYWLSQPRTQEGEPRGLDKKIAAAQQYESNARSEKAVADREDR